MTLEYLIIAAVALDLVLGDPRWLPHPVKLMAALAVAMEKVTRKVFQSEYLAGAITAFTVISVSGAVAFAVVFGAGFLHPVAGYVVGAIVLYTTFAARDLVVHSNAVYLALIGGDINLARNKVAMIVGRDTENLDETEIARAAVETVAENTVDGVTAPLFYAAIFGPVGAIVYKAANTLDSTFGYKNDRYIKFGWCSAKFDDVVNYLPARLTSVCVAIASFLIRANAGNAVKILARDGRKHPSPNAGLCEAAMSGALNVQLGGLNYYFGKPSEKPLLGDPGEAIAASHIKRANVLMLATYFVCMALLLSVRVIVVKLILG